MKAYDKGFRDGIQAFEDLLNEKSIVPVSAPSDVNIIHEFIRAHGAVVREPTELAIEIQRDVMVAIELFEAVGHVLARGLVYQKKSEAKNHDI